MRRIDLFCKLGGPLFISLLTLHSSTFAALFLAGSNLASFPFEYYFILVVHSRFPALRAKTTTQRASSSRPQRSRSQKLLELPGRTITSWKKYYQSPVFSASLALSMLYFTVLSFGGNRRSIAAKRRVDDCFSFAVLRFLGSSDCWASCNRSHCRDPRYDCRPDGNARYWSDPCGDLVPFVANRPAPARCNHPVSAPRSNSASGTPGGICVRKSTWSMGI
jgi:Ferroportin1 (FPN1)